ncbi:NEDD8-specific protease 1-like [Durio zibethinus]|uniref:NEDD8-specific protease 1-like n=1 Tax=Durio zibethinus TaxID=66656 RepID=A0A6P5ZU55_DURZI|nr:NEDD8-specific protease 1-like [Durio zibethinus]XP_022756077.1 NEDD8-specific protease 1-like [Durio zibethinus]
MGKSAADEKILSYNDVVLRRSDLEILSGRYYLNDRIVEFYFSLLSSSHPSHDILLVPPSISFWITNCPDVGDLKDFLEPLKLPDKKLVIFSVNNNDDVSAAEGGSHWSLLAYCRSANVFVHHDSNGQMNKRHAMRLFKSLVGYIGSSSSDCNAKYLECIGTPQQVNSYDCGLYVTATARTICCWYVSSENKDATDLWFSAVKEQVTPSVVSEMRKEILGLIKDLMAKK